jgi:hypothetical protein
VGARRTFRAIPVSAALVSLVALSSLGCLGSPPSDGPIGVSRSAIAYGTLDTTHTAVVAVLAPVTSTELQECTGTIVQVSGGNGYVLTAAHCCNTYVPTVVVVSNDYTDGEPYLSSGTPVPPAYRVVPGSVSYDPMYNSNASQPDHDFCMLQFSGATASTPTIALPTSTNDGLVAPPNGSLVEHVGFGITEDGGPNAGRRAGTNQVDGLTSLTIEFNQGGDAEIPGTCSGDSGGPSLLPATGSQQVVVGVDSYGNSMTCSGETIGVASRVSSAIGPGGFITSYLPPPSTPPPVVAVPAVGRFATALAVGLFAIGIWVIRAHQSKPGKANGMTGSPLRKA